MHSAKRRSHPGEKRQTGGSQHRRWPAWLRTWVYVWSAATGLLAVAWLLLRSGTKPSRLAYPCQQAAAGTAIASFGVPIISSLIIARKRIAGYLHTRVGKMVLGGAAACAAALFAVASFDSAPDITILDPPADYFPEVFLVNDARGIEPGRYGGVDDLISLMGIHNLKWHRSETMGQTSGPGGMIDADDVVLIKINAQWAQRGSTNTDVLRGVIRQVVEHPDGFTGEVVVADNGQGAGSVTRLSDNNAEDRYQSTQDVVDDFVAEGWTVSTMLWDTIRSTSVAEYVSGDLNNGYVINSTKDPETQIYVSYPKFQTAGGAFLSYKHGIWSETSHAYDPGGLVVVNMPVLKTHSIYAVTAAVKNHMGVVTTAFGTGSHVGVANGGLGSILAEVRCPDLTILDCIWILARPTEGPWAYYDRVSRRDQLLAGTDPVALDAWATKYILMPQIQLNGYTVADYGNWQNPDNPGSVFRNYLDKSMNEMLLAGIPTTNDYNAVTLREWVDPSIPTVSQWGLAALGLLVLTAASVMLGKTPPIPRETAPSTRHKIRL